MGGFAMPTPASGAKLGGTGAVNLGSQLYAGGTNATGSSLPGPTMTAGGPTHFSAQGSTPTMPSGAATSTATAPAGLNVSQNPGGTNISGTVNNATGTTGSDAQRLLGENQNYFGQGVGATLTNYLNSGAGYNGALAQQTVNATDQAMQQQINQQYGTLQTQMAEAGLSPNSSAFQLGSSSFLSNASAQENEVAAQQYTQMYSQAQTDYLSALQMIAGVNAQGTANQQTWQGALGSVLTGGVGGLLQYTGGNAGMAGNVTSTSGIFGGNGSSSGSGSFGNDAASLLGF